MTSATYSVTSSIEIVTDNVHQGAIAADSSAADNFDGPLGPEWMLGVPVLSSFDALELFTIEDGAAVGPKTTTSPGEAASMLWTEPHPGEHQVIEVTVETSRALGSNTALMLQNFIDPDTGIGWMCQITWNRHSTSTIEVLNYCGLGFHYDEINVDLPA